MAQPSRPHRQPVYPWPAPEEIFTPEDLPDHAGDGHWYEIIEGGLHVAPPAGIKHHHIADAVVQGLATAAPGGWLAVRGVGLRIGDSLVTPDLTVLRPGADLDATWCDPDDVALIAEVESPGSRKHDRFTKPALYAEAGIESYWRVEQTDGGAVAHLYEGVSGGHYRHHRSVNPGESHLAELPYPVQVTPATWHT